MPQADKYAASDGSFDSQPQVNATLRYGTTSVNTPRARWSKLTCTQNMPPGLGSKVWFRPNHCAINIGSTRKAKMVSGEAAIKISRSMITLSLLTLASDSVRRLRRHL